MQAAPLRRAFTLPEIVVGTVLMSILATVLASLLVSQLRISRRLDRRLQLSRTHLFLEETLRADITQAASASISLQPGGEGLSIQPFEDVTPEGTARYSTSKFVAYLYDTSAGLLRRRVWETSQLPLVLASPPVKLLPADWTNLVTASGGRTQKFEALRAFRFRSENPGEWLSPRIWADCEWLHDGRLWKVSYCCSSRQLP
jgi:prepilin-type N-terminal cleavage/methylation domain-containing protein